jgi:hypothetical protein
MGKVASKLSPTEFVYKDELRMNVERDNDGNIRILFGAPVTWFAMPVEEALKLAKLLLKLARR